MSNEYSHTFSPYLRYVVYGLDSSYTIQTELERAFTPALVYHAFVRLHLSFQADHKGATFTVLITFTRVLLYGKKVSLDIQHIVLYSM